MKGSPTRNINSRDYGDSPYKSILNNTSQARQSRSPARGLDATYNSSSDDYWRNRAKTL